VESGNCDIEEACCSNGILLFVFAFLRSRLGDTRMTKSDGEKEFDEPEAEPPPEASQSKVFDPRVESLEF